MCTARRSAGAAPTHLQPAKRAVAARSPERPAGALGTPRPPPKPPNGGGSSSSRSGRRLAPAKGRPRSELRVCACPAPGLTPWATARPPLSGARNRAPCPSRPRSPFRPPFTPPKRAAPAPWQARARQPMLARPPPDSQKRRKALWVMGLRAFWQVIHRLPTGPGPGSQGVRKATGATGSSRQRPLGTPAGRLSPPIHPIRPKLFSPQHIRSYPQFGMPPAPRSQGVRKATRSYTKLHTPATERSGRLEAWGPQPARLGPFRCPPFLHSSNLPSLASAYPSATAIAMASVMRIPQPLLLPSLRAQHTVTVGSIPHKGEDVKSKM